MTGSIRNEYCQLNETYGLHHTKYWVPEIIKKKLSKKTKQIIFFFFILRLGLSGWSFVTVSIRNEYCQLNETYGLHHTKYWVPEIIKKKLFICIYSFFFHIEAGPISISGVAHFFWIVNI